MRRKESSLLWMCLMLVLFLSISVHPEGVYEVWVSRYNGPGNNPDHPTTLIADDNGSIYVTGYSSGGTTNLDYATIKYSSIGDTLWTRRYNGSSDYIDQSLDLAVDTGGNPYLTGVSWGIGTLSDFATIKYSSSGDIIWVRRYDRSGAGNDAAHAIAVDGDGNVYVTGGGQVTSLNRDYLTIKYSSVGDTLWVRTYNGPGNGYDDALDLAADNDGNVYVTGVSGGGTSEDYSTIKYSPSGDTLWVRRYNGPGDGTDVARVMALDDSGNVYVTGYSFGTGTDFDFATIKYSSSGDTFWIRRYNGPADSGDAASALAIDDIGNVYVSGGSMGIGNSTDFATIKYSPAGDTLWVRRYNGPGNDSDYTSDLVLDNSGNVYVTGSSVGFGTSLDFTTIKYSSDGNKLWVKRYNGPGNAIDHDTDVQVDDSGNVYLTGQSYGGASGYDYATIKYVPCTPASPKAADADANGNYTLADMIAAVNYIFNKPGCTPLPLCWLSGLLCRGDWNGSNTVTLADVIQGVNYIFNKPGGPWNPVSAVGCCP